MSFVNPLLLAGLGLVSLPIIIHLINRRRAVRRPFPAIEFLFRSNKRLARRLKIKQLLLLLLRVLIFVLLPLAMARPYLLSASGVTAGERLPTAVVIVLDDSFSMGHSTGGESAFDRARQIVLDELDELRPWDEVALVLAHDPPEAPVADLDEDAGRVRDVVEELMGPSSFAGSLPAALRMAADIHALGELPARRTLVVTDNTAAAWAGENPDAALLARLGLVNVVEARSGDSLGNPAIVGTGYAESRTGGEGDADVWVRVANPGDAVRTDVRLDLEVDGELVGSSVLDLEGDGEQTVTFTVPLGHSGLHRAHARLVTAGPNVEADDHAYLTLHLDREVQVLLVNGDPRTVRYRDEVFYLERALRAGPEDDSGIHPIVVGADELDVPFDQFDVVVLANVGSLARGRVAELASFVRAGGGLLFTGGNRVEAAHFNELFGELLPKRLRSVRELCEPNDPDANLLATRIARVQSDHPVFRVFDLPGGESIQSVTVYSYLLLEPSPAGSAETLASYGDGGPALVERELGAGRVALLTTSIDRDWTDFPIRTAFLPTLRRLVRYLARRGTSDTDAEAGVGHRFVLDVEAQRPERVIVTDPVGARYVLNPEPPDPTSVALVPALPGHYEVALDIAGATRPADDLGFAANLDPAESELREAEATRVSAWEAGEATAETGRDGATLDIPERRLSLWPPLLFVALLVLYLESGLSARRRLWTWLGERLRRSARPSA